MEWRILVTIQQRSDTGVAVEEWSDYRRVFTSGFPLHFADQIFAKLAGILDLVGSALSIPRGKV